MATANRFQTRVVVPDKSSLSHNEIRLNLLLTQAQTYLQTLNDLQINEYNNNEIRESKFDYWSSHMFEKIDHSYKICLHDLKQSFEQLKLFQQMMINILNNENENYLDGKKLSTIEHEICILKCLTYQLDTTKVKIEGKLKSNQEFNHDEYDMSNDDENYSDNQTKLNEKKPNKDFLCRILIPYDAINKIEDLPLFQQYVQMTTNQIHDATPERILTINGPHHLDVIENILSTLYSSTINPCELRILLHQSYAPLILGKLGDRAKILREKYSLHTLTIHPTCAPKSTERVLLIQSSSNDEILACLKEIFININQHIYDGDDLLLYNEINYDASLAHEYGGFASSEIISRSNDQHNHEHDEKFLEEEDEGIRRYSAFDAWNGSVEADTDHEFSIVKLSDDSIIREFWINHGQFGALLGPHGIRIAQIRSQCRTVRIHTVAGSSIDTCSVKVIGPRADVNRAVNLIIQSIKEHDRKFPFKHHRFSGRLR
ncbi:unnamed protein product [Adineta steineri]|uniref:K Homology domain-containing protein n=1 Tax=Adineta steineri TaxID=433720 RepID=A0A813XR58_9BILA|nr:unnamed protein product [Adineta steineri]CAF0874062.1 unnamed protein product [Adineta steineri]CAF3513902.1 unnamed protein product [Adineta steineri]